MEELGIDPISIIVDGDPDAMARAIENGCDREHIEAIIEYVNTLVFNDQVHARNEEFERQQSEREDDQWTYEWSKKNPAPEGEMNHDGYTKASEHNFFKDLGKDPETYEHFRKSYEDWGDIKGLGRMMKVVHDAGMSSINMHTCQECNFCTQATNKLCPFCKRHMKDIYNPSVSDGTQASYGSRIIQRLAKSLITDNNHPGCAFPYRGMHSLMWRQMTRLLKYHYSWRHKRTWCYNSRDPGAPFESLMDRIMHDDVFRLNLILNGGWTKDTFHILEELIELALKQKEWNKRFGHLSYADRKNYYKRRAERFANKRCSSDEQQVRPEDRVHPTREEHALPSGLDGELLRAQKQAEALAKQKGIGKTSKKRTGTPDPAE